MPNKQGSSFGDTIYTLRQEKGLTLRALADRSGISYGRLGEIERGIDAHSGKPFVPTYQAVLRLARALEAPPEEMLRLAGYEPNDEPKHQELELLELFRGFSAENRLELLRKAHELAGESEA